MRFKPLSFFNFLAFLQINQFLWILTLTFPISPCPNVFLYKFDGVEWFGEIKAMTSSQKSFSILKVTMALRIAHDVQMRHSEVSIVGDVPTGRNVHLLTFRVTFPQQFPLPKLIQITFGDHVLCLVSGVIISAIESVRIINLIYLVKTIVQPTSIFLFTKPFHGQHLDVDFNVPPPPPTSTSSELSSGRCGNVKTALEIRSLIFGGDEVKRGEWPWLVAVFQIDVGFGPSFACGGNLVSKRAVISAAHCVKSASKTYQSHEVLLSMGHHNRLIWNEIDSMRSNVAKIHIHPDFRVQTKAKATTKDADLAILIASQIIEFNDFIQPVCLWSNDRIDEDDTPFGMDTIGTVVGWGRHSVNRLVSKFPRKIELPIVEFDECRLSSNRVAAALSNRTFCAGLLDGLEGPCHGDSGSGLMVYRNNRWMMRGIVSAGVTNGNNGLCVLTEYIIFTDIAKFLSWIHQHIV